MDQEEQEFAYFFDNLTVDSLLPLDDLSSTILIPIETPPPSNSTDIIQIPTNTPNVSNIVLSAQAHTTQKAMDRAVQSFTSFNVSGEISEDTVLSWLVSCSTKYTPTSLWTMFSLLKKYLLWQKKVDLGKAPNIQQFLKTLNKTHKKKKAPAFTREQIYEYLDNIPTTPPIQPLDQDWCPFWSIWCNAIC
jgi:hypothetical protein